MAQARTTTASTSTAPADPVTEGLPTPEEFGTDEERVSHGFAPLRDETDLRSREQREADAREALGDPPKATPMTDEQAARRYTLLRAAPVEPAASSSSAIVNGVAVTVAEGETAPAEVQEVLDNKAQLIRTGQMKGLGNGLRVVPAGEASAAIAATAEATAAPAPAAEPAASRSSSTSSA